MFEHQWCPGINGRVLNRLSASHCYLSVLRHCRDVMSSCSAEIASAVAAICSAAACIRFVAVLTGDGEERLRGRPHRIHRLSHWTTPP